jgi:serine protease Do
MEIDAAINPGNSGGALINLKGEIIGINSAGIEGAQGINYAISVATARHVYSDLVEGRGAGHHPYVGVIVDDNVVAIPGEPFGLLLSGAEIIVVDPKGPSAAAGLKFGDVVTKFNGQSIGSASDFIRILWRLDIGAKATLVIKRGSSEMTVEITMPRRPATSDFV